MEIQIVDRSFTAVSLTTLALHVAALVVDLRLKRGPLAVMVLNLAVAGLVLAYLGLHTSRMKVAPDGQLIALAVFEAVVVAAALGPNRNGVAGIATWTAFGLHFAAAALAVVLALTFRITRLF